MDQNSKTDALKVCLTLHLIASVTCFISVFLPYVNVINANFSLANFYVNENNKEYGYLILLLGASGLAFAFSLAKKTEWGICGAIILITERYSTHEIWEGKNGTELSGFEKVLYKVLISKEIGYYSIIIGAVVLILTGVVYSCMVRNENRLNNL